MTTTLPHWLTDVRWVYLLMTVAILAGLLLPFTVDVPATEYALAVYNAVESIEPGDIALIIDFAVPYMDDYYARKIVAQHIIEKEGHCIWYCENSVSVPYMLKVMEEIYGPNWEERPDYGEKFAYFGYIPLSLITLSNIAVDASLVFKEDAFGTPVSELPIMEPLHDGNDVALLLGFPGCWRVIGSIYGPYETKYLHVETVGGLVGRIDTYRAGLLSGMVGGATGTAQYETLTGISSPETWMFLTPMLYLSALGAIGFIVPNIYALVFKKEEA